MKKQNLTFGQKIAAAAFTVMLASSSLAFVPATALAAEASTYTAAVTQKLYANKIDAVVFRAVYDGTDGNVLKGYDLLLARDGELVGEVEAYNVNADATSSGYTVDLASKGYELAPGATIKYAVDGSSCFGWGVVGEEYYYAYRGDMPTDGITFPTMNVSKDTYVIDGLEFSANGTLLKVKRCDSGAAQIVVDAIDAIGKIERTADCKQRITDAYNAYNALGNEDKKLVTNYQTLRSAREATRGLIAKVDTAVTSIS